MADPIWYRAKKVTEAQLETALNRAAAKGYEPIIVTPVGLDFMVIARWAGGATTVPGVEGTLGDQL